jgi:hypothetical protein
MSQAVYLVILSASYVLEYGIQNAPNGASHDLCCQLNLQDQVLMLSTACSRLNSTAPKLGHVIHLN